MNGSEALNVACVLRSGGEYDAEYVERLRDGVKKHLPMPYRFLCLSDIPVPAEHIPLKHNWPGWWSKIELFRLSPPVLYLDLDTVIVGDLTDIAAQSFKPEFTLLRCFYREKGLGSGLMAWGVPVRKLYDTFAAKPQEWMTGLGTKGDQAFVEQNINHAAVTRWQTVLPGQVVSYKAHVRKAENIREIGDGNTPKDARVVCFHGKPKPREVEWLAA